MKETEYNWDELWDLFEKLILQHKEKQEETISAASISIPMQQELQKLLQAHYSQSSILDKKQQWQLELNQAFQPPKEINGYKIEQKLGSGGIGDVYLASKHEEGFLRKVAIKFATTGRFAKHVLSSFNTELEVLLSLNHPNIERLYDGGITQNSVPFLIVEYIDGTHIDKYCDQQQLNIKQRLILFQKICRAIDAVHRSLIVHRDIKAGNIMVGADGEPKLLDFGLAKLANSDTKANNTITFSGLMMTLAYASPEQVNTSTITTASDIYSLGILLHYLLTGRPPYNVAVNNLSSAINTITQHVPKLASSNINEQSAISKTENKLARKLSGELEQIIAKSIAKKPEHRYISAVALSEDIKNYLENRPIIAKSDSVFYRFHKFYQRHMLGFLLSSTAIASLIVLSIILYLQSKDLKRSLLEINQEQQRVLQITDFLKEIFKISDPLITDKKIVKVKDLLDYSSKQLDTQFIDQPITKAKLYETLGNVYFDMSVLPQAQAMFSKANSLYEQNNENEGVLNTRLAIIRLYQQMGKLKKAQSILDQLLVSKYFDELPLQNQAEIETINGQNKYKLGRLDQARKMFESSLQKRLALFGQEHQLVVNIYQLLGNVYWRLGDFKKVKSYYQLGFNINKKTMGSNHHKTLMSRSSLGLLAHAQGNYDVALNHYNFVAEARLHKLGSQHILTAEAHNRLGALYYEMGQYQQAQQKLQMAKDIFNKLKLSQSLKYARTLNNLGLVEREHQQYKKAQTTFLQAKTIGIKELGENHVEVASTNNNLAIVAADLGNISQALVLFKQTYAILYKKQAHENVSIAFSMTNIGRMYLQLDNVEEAKKWIDQALKLRLEKLGSDNAYYAETLSASAEVDIAQNNLDVAKNKLKKVLSIRQQQLGKGDWRTAESKALYAITTLSVDQNAPLQFQCNLKLIIDKLGLSHYRTKKLLIKKQQYKIEHEASNSACQFLF